MQQLSFTSISVFHLVLLLSLLSSDYCSSVSQSEHSGRGPLTSLIVTTKSASVTTLNNTAITSFSLEPGHKSFSVLVLRWPTSAAPLLCTELSVGVYQKQSEALRGPSLISNCPVWPHGTPHSIRAAPDCVCLYVCACVRVCVLIRRVSASLVLYEPRLRALGEEGGRHTTGRTETGAADTAEHLLYYSSSGAQHDQSLTWQQEGSPHTHTHTHTHTDSQMHVAYFHNCVCVCACQRAGLHLPHSSFSSGCRWCFWSFFFLHRSGKELLIGEAVCVCVCACVCHLRQTISNPPLLSHPSRNPLLEPLSNPTGNESVLLMSLRGSVGYVSGLCRVFVTKEEMHFISRGSRYARLAWNVRCRLVSAHSCWGLSPVNEAALVLTLWRDGWSQRIFSQGAYFRWSAHISLSGGKQNMGGERHLKNAICQRGMQLHTFTTSWKMYTTPVLKYSLMRRSPWSVVSK